jgi:hypothetical protein
MSQKYINRHNGKVSHIFHSGGLSEELKTLYHPICGKYFAVPKQDSSLSDNPKYRVCGRCLQKRFERLQKQFERVKVSKVQQE